MTKIFFLLLFNILLCQTVFAQLDFTNPNQRHHYLLTEMDSTILKGKYEQITSVLIAKNGGVLFEKYYNGANQNTQHNTRSVTKTMATLLAGIALKQGFITSEKDKIFTYLKPQTSVKNPDDRKRNITMEDLMTMSSMLECDDTNMFSRGHEERMYIVEDWTSFYLDLPIQAFPFGPKPEEQPYGRSFRYCSAGAAAMAEILQNAINTPLDAFAKQHLFDPLGIKDYTLHYNPKGILNTAGGSEYRSRDFLKLIQLCLNNGVWKGDEIIPESWIKKATSPKATFQDGVDYGYFFWLKSFGKTKKYAAYYMSGNGGQKVLALPDLDVTVVITTQNYGNRNAHIYTDALMNTFIVPALTNE